MHTLARGVRSDKISAWLAAGTAHEQLVARSGPFWGSLAFPAHTSPPSLESMKGNYSHQSKYNIRAVRSAHTRPGLPLPLRSRRSCCSASESSHQTSQSSINLRGQFDIAHNSSHRHMDVHELAEEAAAVSRQQPARTSRRPVPWAQPFSRSCVLSFATCLFDRV